MSISPGAPFHRTPSPDIGDGVPDGISSISGLNSQGSLSPQLPVGAQWRSSGAGLADMEHGSWLISREEAERVFNIARGHLVDGSSNYTGPPTVFEEPEEMEEAAGYDHPVALAISQDTPIPPQPDHPPTVHAQLLQRVPFLLTRSITLDGQWPQHLTHDRNSTQSASPLASHTEAILPPPSVERAIQRGSPSVEERRTANATDRSSARLPPIKAAAVYSTPAQAEEVKCSWLSASSMRMVKDAADFLRVQAPSEHIYGAGEEPAVEGDKELATKSGEKLAEELTAELSDEDNGVEVHESPRKTNILCLVCRQEVRAGYTAPCGHTYDRDCLIELFRMATHDESLYPPSCCKQRIYVLSVRAFLPPSVVGAYVRKAREYETRHHVDEEPAAEGDEGLRGSEVEVHGSSRKPDILCSVCRNEVRGGYTAPCGHTYDRDCLSGLFRMATHDESLYPPSCCKQRIYVLSVRAFLPPSVVGAYVKKAKEYETRCRIGKESLVESESGKVHGDKKIQVHDSTRKTSILCAACREEVPVCEGYMAPCGHTFDSNCLSELFRQATYDESLYPPNCCQQPIDILSVGGILPPSVASTFTEKAREYDTLDRVYCHRSECHTFLGAATAKPSSIHCPRCPDRAATCGKCKAMAHRRLRCFATSEFNQFAVYRHALRGWQQ